MALNLDRGQEFPHLGDRVYADWTGAAIPPVSLIKRHTELLTTELLGNPHSHHSSSTRAMELVNQTRRAVLAYFNADPDEYDVIWTPNASGAILMLQHYLWQGGELLLTADNHNTMNGLREIARLGGGLARYAPLSDDLSLDEDALRRMLGNPQRIQNRVFGYPAKSNYSGIEHPLEWIAVAQDNGWDVILDAAAFLANRRLDLSAHKPEYVPVSFYKMFGYPTGLGCLLVKRSVYKRMFKKWFSGGSIILVSVMSDFHILEPPSPARYEDGTLAFGQIPAIAMGLKWLESLGDRREHASQLASKLYDGLHQMSMGQNTVMIHSPRGADIVTFSVLRDGEHVNAWEVEQAADRQGIQFRTGCFCDPGANECTMGYTVEEFQRVLSAEAADAVSLETLKEHSGGKPIGAVRASFGYINVESDVERILDWIRGYLAEL